MSLTKNKYHLERATTRASLALLEITMLLPVEYKIIYNIHNLISNNLTDTILVN